MSPARSFIGDEDISLQDDMDLRDVPVREQVEESSLSCLLVTVLRLRKNLGIYEFDCLIIAQTVKAPLQSFTQLQDRSFVLY